jgi:hypothetical protein
MGHNDHCLHEGEIVITPAICAGCPQSQGCPYMPEIPEDSVEWYLTENLCNECYKKIDGCDHQYDDALCLATRRHFSWYYK